MFIAKKFCDAGLRYVAIEFKVIAVSSVGWAFRWQGVQKRNIIPY